MTGVEQQLILGRYPYDFYWGSQRLAQTNNLVACWQIAESPARLPCVTMFPGFIIVFPHDHCEASASRCQAS